MRKRRIMILVVLLVIGFAAVSTTLIMNGSVNLGFNENEFDVYFSEATLNGEDKKTEFISSDGKTLTFNTQNLSLVGDQAVVYYEVTNASRHYDAEVKLVCDDFENEYVSVTNVLNASVIEAQSSADGVLIAELVKASVESQSVDLTCRITANPTSRDSVAEDAEVGDVTTYSLYGYLVDSGEAPIEDVDVVVYSNEPHFTKTDNRGYFYVSGLEKGSHEIYYVKTDEDLTNKTKEEIKSLAISSSTFTTSSGSVVFKNDAKIKDVVVELTNNATYNITLKTGNGAIISDHYEVTQNKPYGDLPVVEVVNSSFLHWTLEDGTIITNNSLVATNVSHTLIAVMSPVVAPVIEASNSNWTDKDVEVSIKTPGSADVGIKNYEYLITSKSEVLSTDTPTGTTTGSITVSNTGSNYVYYRTVALDDAKSAWSTGVVVRIDKTAPSNVNFSNKVVSSSNVTLNVNYTEDESSIKETKCYYGDASSQTSLGEAKNDTCVYPASAEYSKVCVVNSVGKETCSSPKKLAEYFFKNGVPQVEFEKYNPEGTYVTTTQKDGYYLLEVGYKTSEVRDIITTERSGIYTKEKYDFSKMNYAYSELDFSMSAHQKTNPTLQVRISKGLWFAHSEEEGVNAYYYDWGDITEDISISDSVKKYISRDFSSETDSWLMIGKNSSKQYSEIKIYNIWFQLTE